jgi:hypothetical protein
MWLPSALRTATSGSHFKLPDFSFHQTLFAISEYHNQNRLVAGGFWVDELD